MELAELYQKFWQDAYGVPGILYVRRVSNESNVNSLALGHEADDVFSTLYCPVSNNTNQLPQLKIRTKQ
jgi:hypothetical protein